MDDLTLSHLQGDCPTCGAQVVISSVQHEEESSLSVFSCTEGCHYDQKTVTVRKVPQQLPNGDPLTDTS